jgi:hypothetical protein
MRELIDFMIISDTTSGFFVPCTSMEMLDSFPSQQLHSNGIAPAVLGVGTLKDRVEYPYLEYSHRNKVLGPPIYDCSHKT